MWHASHCVYLLFAVGRKSERLTSSKQGERRNESRSTQQQQRRSHNVEKLACKRCDLHCKQREANILPMHVTRGLSLYVEACDGAAEASPRLVAPVPSPKAWVEMMSTALGPLPKQSRQIQLATACSGTGAPCFGLQAVLSGSKTVVGEASGKCKLVGLVLLCVGVLT